MSSSDGPSQPKRAREEEMPMDRPLGSTGSDTDTDSTEIHMPIEDITPQESPRTSPFDGAVAELSSEIIQKKVFEHMVRLHHRGEIDLTVLEGHEEVLSFNGLVTLTERVLQERDDEIRAAFSRILQARLDEQREELVRITQIQMQEQFHDSKDPDHIG